MSILLIDGDNDNRTMYAEFLRLHRYVCITADTSDTAVRFAQSVDVIVTGLQVPGTFDGLELIRRVRRSAATRTTPIIVLTACVFPQDRRRSIEAGCSAFLTKPCLPDDLVATIERVAAVSLSAVASRDIQRRAS
jgi:two-component system, cell cycle response regulator DivK